MTYDTIALRYVLARSIRAFFHKKSFIEVETPVRLKIPCMELHIDAEPSGDYFLRTSPEMFHKQLLSAGYKQIFEMGKCFRHGEYGPLHHPEYTMLEWYRIDADYLDILDDTKALISAVWKGSPNNWKILTISDIFLEYAGWDPVKNYNEDRFNSDLVGKVEPAIRDIGGAMVLKDYPLEAAALSRRKAANPLLAERWELYINGVELANAYSELTDPDEQRKRFEICAEKRRKLGKAVYPIDEQFLQALENLTEAGGAALGVDRLLMLITEAGSLDAVIPFR